MTAKDLKEIASQLLGYVSITSPNLTERQLADYYLADPEIYKKTVEALPSEKRLDSDGNRLSESELYNNAVDSVQTSQLNYTEDEKKEIYLFSQLNAVGNFATGSIVTDSWQIPRLLWLPPLPRNYLVSVFLLLGKEKF